ncbi:Uncharacterized protein HZ326_23641 [Fusarium oxysporum f. sp. albedinis]|nr:Uncharacterized protein HZ326_23641 [Fusarium oxysporum f. sp. albedinis]
MQTRGRQHSGKQTIQLANATNLDNETVCVQTSATAGRCKINSDRFMVWEMSVIIRIAWNEPSVEGHSSPKPMPHGLSEHELVVCSPC